MLFTLFVGVLTAFAVPVLTVYFLHRRLYVVTSYLAFSPLAPKGKTVSFTILNRGHRSEEAIRLQLDPTREYTLLAASSGVVSLDESVISLSRLTPRDSVQVIVAVEGGDFDDSKVLGLDSRDTKGKPTSKLEDVPAPPGVAAIALVILACFLLGPPIGVAYFVAHDKEFREAVFAWAADEGEGDKAPSDPAPDQREAVLKAKGWRDLKDYFDTSLVQFYGSGEFPIEIEYVKRVGDLVILNLTVTNKTPDWMEVTASLKSPAEKPDLARTVDYLPDLMVLPNSTVSRTMSVYLPVNSTPQVVRAGFHIKTDKVPLLYDLVKIIDTSQSTKATSN